MNDPSATEFNEVYYEKLMDGLEINEISLSDLERTSRIDAEFYQKKNLFVEQVLDKWDKYAFSQCFNVSDGNHMSISDEFCNKGVPYYRGQDIYSLFIENSSPLYISDEAYNKAAMRRSYLKKGDVLMSIVGAIIGNSALVTSDRKATCSCKLAILRACDENIIPEMMFIFIKTKYGQNQIQKFKRGAAQTGLLLEDFEQLYIPKFSKKLQYICKEYVDKIKLLIDEAVHTYGEAEQELIKSLGLQDFNSRTEQYDVKSFKNSFGDTGRLDAEFYQKKYDLIEGKLRNYDTNIKRLNEVAKYIFTGEYAEEYFDYGEGRKYYIRGTDIGRGYVKTNDEYCIDPKLYSKFAKKGDIITGRVGTIGNFGIIDEDLEGSVCSDNILCFHLPENYVPEAYALYFNLTFTKELITRLARGSVQQRLNQETLRDILVPFINVEIQEKLRRVINKSREMELEAKKMLDKVVLIVETAIEQGEDVASNFYV